MPESSQENERRRLVDLYLGMSDRELEQLAADAASLKQVATEILQAEISRRGLKTELRYPAASTESATPGKLVTLRTFRDAPSALLAKSILESADMECFLGDENIVRMDWFWSNVVGGIKLWVREEDAATAAELLNQEVPQDIDPDEV
jgi:hypothetical protein